MHLTPGPTTCSVSVMENYPKNLLEFRQRFASEASCVEYLAALRWPNGFECPACSHKEARRNPRGLLECQECRRQTSVTAGTLFHDTHKPPRLWFEAMWHITNQKYGANALGLQRLLGLGSYHTAWKWLHRLRRAMVRPGRDCLSGLVEVDETYIGGESSGKRGRGAEHKALVVIAVEDKSKKTKRSKCMGRIRLQHISDASAYSLCDFIRTQISAGSRIRTDGWTGYQPLSTMGYGHLTVGSRELTITHLVASLLKRWLLGTYQGAVQFHHLAYYLDEFTFRFNRRSSRSRGKLFYRLVQQAVVACPVKGSQIIGGNNLPASKESSVNEMASPGVEF